MWFVVAVAERCHSGAILKKIRQQIVLLEKGGQLVRDSTFQSFRKE